MNKNSNNPVIFSFGQQANSQDHSRIKECPAECVCKNKIEFLQKLIQKYEPKKKQNVSQENSSSQSTYQELQINKMKQQFQTSHRKHFKSEELSQEKKEQPILVQLKTHLEQSHQQILSKYLTPAKDESYQHILRELDQQSILHEDTINQFMRSSQEISVQFSRLNISEEIPLVESMMMLDEEFQKNKIAEEIKKFVINEISEFEVIQKPIPKDDLKISHVLLVCFVILVFFCLTM